MTTDIKMLENLLSPEELRDIKEFYKSSWDSSYDFIVYNSLKSLTLNAMIFSHHYKDAIQKHSEEQEELKNLREFKFLASEGLLLKLEDLADKYILTGDFGNILLVDLIVVYGDIISEFYFNLEKVLIDILNRKGCNIPKEKIRKDLLNSLEYRVYMAEENKLLVSKELKDIFYVQNTVSANKFTRFLFDIDRILSDSDKYQTMGFFPSYFIDYDNYYIFENKIKGNFSKHNWCYEFKNLTFYDKFIEKEDKLKAYYGFYVINGSRLRYSVIPMVFWNKLDIDDIKEISKELSNKIAGCENVISILNEDKDYLQPIKVKLLGTLFSISLFGNYIQGIKGKLGEVENNIKLMSLYFGGNHDLMEELLSISDNIEMCKQLFRIFTVSLSLIKSEIGKKEDKREQSYNSLILLENYISSLRLGYLKSIRNKNVNDFVFDENTKYHEEEISLVSYLANTNMMGISDLLNVLMIMMKNGNIEIKSNDIDCNFSLRTTASVNLVIVKGFYRFIPAILKLKEQCVEKNKDFEEAIILFGKCAEEDENDKYIGKKLLSFVKQLEDSGFVLNTGYEYGSLWLDVPNLKTGVRVFKEWSNIPWSEKELGLFKGMSSDWYSNYEEKVQKKYLGYVCKIV